MTEPYRRRPSVALAALAVALLALVACSDDGTDTPSAQERLDELGITDPPDEVITVSVEQLDPTAVVGTELNSVYLRLRFALKGYSWAEAECAVGKVIEIVTPEAFDALPAARLESLSIDAPDSEAQARTCASPQSIARIDAEIDKKAVPVPNAAPDIDGAAVKSMFEALYRLSADQLGLTAAETDCIVEKVLAPRSADDFVKIVTGADRISIEDTAPDVVGCLQGAGRVDEVTVAAAELLIERRKADAAEHDRVQARIDEMAAEKSATTTP